MERKTYQITRGQLVALLAALLVGAMLTPSAVEAATGQFVNIRDFSNKSKSGKAKVSKNKLWVGDGAGALTVDGSVQQAPARPFTADCNAANSLESVSCSITVPAGRRLVIETASIGVDVVGGQEASARLIARTQRNVNSYWVPLQHQRTYASGGRRFYAGNPNIRLYADAGTTVTLTADRQGGGVFSIGLRVSGYLL